MIYNDILKCTKQKKSNKKIYGFDIETYDNNKKFYCASIWGDDYYKFFFSKREVIEELKHSRYRNCIVCATNLGFDFMGTFFGEPEEDKFQILFRGSDLLFARTYIIDGKYNRRSYTGKKRGEGNTGHSILFLDTFNYAKISVEKAGSIIKLPKLKKPACLGRLPKNEEEKAEMLKYNLRDSEVSQKFMKFLYESFSELGATPKNTIASTTMSLFKNKYLGDDIYWRQPKEILLDLFKGYYGGRTEGIGRGKIQEYNYYDINSLYPFVMLNSFPDPNHCRTTKKNTLEHIEKYEGMSKVDIVCPPMQYPYLPHRYDGKLLFTVGDWTGWYTHYELNKALSLGYKINKVHKTHYYTKTCKPFVNFVNDLYKLRLQFKDKKNPMEKVVKLLLNSLYGKFGQKFQNKDNYISGDTTLEELQKYDYVEPVGNYFRIKTDCEPSSFCIPIWASYVTAYARTVLHDFMVQCHPVYVDTDSVICKGTLSTSSVLGDMKLEMKIHNGWIVKPKMYAVHGELDNEKISMVKVKGIGKRLTIEEFRDLLENPKVAYLKFTKFKEAIRRGLIPNELLEMEKNLSLDDNKRVWSKPIDLNGFEVSIPRVVHDTEINWRKLTITYIKHVSLVKTVLNIPIPIVEVV